MAKIHTFFTFDNIYQTETLESLKLGYPSTQGILTIVSSNEKFLCPVFDIFLHQQIGDFKMAFLAQLSSSVVSKK